MKRSPWCCLSLVLMVGIVVGGFFVKDLHNLSQVGWHHALIVCVGFEIEEVFQHFYGVLHRE
jgi:hypothetical protein